MFVRRQEVDRDLDPDLAQLLSHSLAFGDLVVAPVVGAVRVTLKPLG
jgi:hypothetical protein